MGRSFSRSVAAMAVGIASGAMAHADALPIRTALNSAMRGVPASADVAYSVASQSLVDFSRYCAPGAAQLSLHASADEISPDSLTVCAAHNAWAGTSNAWYFDAAVVSGDGRLHDWADFGAIPDANGSGGGDTRYDPDGQLGGMGGFDSVDGSAATIGATDKLTLIPAPGALLLGLIGFCCARSRRLS